MEADLPGLISLCESDEIGSRTGLKIQVLRVRIPSLARVGVVQQADTAGSNPVGASPGCGFNSRRE